jgi:hypothetical protein
MNYKIKLPNFINGVDLVLTLKALSAKCNQLKSIKIKDN